MESILVQGSEVKANIQDQTAHAFNQSVSESTIVGSDQTINEDGLQSLKIVNEKVHRNSEVPADYVMELLFDVLNRSINLHFNLPDETRIFKVIPDERNVKTTKIAQYLIKRGWKAPGFHFRKD